MVQATVSNASFSALDVLVEDDAVVETGSPFAIASPKEVTLTVLISQFTVLYKMYIHM
jgi:hypothetical protein